MKNTGMILLAAILITGLSACKATVHDGPRKVMCRMAMAMAISVRPVRLKKVTARY